MKINLDNLRDYIKIERNENHITVETIEHVDADGKTSKTIKTIKTPCEETIDSVKYEFISRLIDIVLNDADFIDDRDEGDSWKEKENSGEEDSYTIALNTLLEYNIIEI